MPLPLDAKAAAFLIRGTSFGSTLAEGFHTSYPQAGPVSAHDHPGLGAPTSITSVTTPDQRPDQP